MLFFCRVVRQLINKADRSTLALRLSFSLYTRVYSFSFVTLFIYFFNIPLYSVLILDFCLGKTNKNTTVRSKTLAKQKASLLPSVVLFC